MEGVGSSRSGCVCYCNIALATIQTLVAVTLALVCPLVARASAGEEILPLSQVQVGMKGIGRTVFAGTNPEDYGFEVVGVWKGESPGRDMIVVRCTGRTIERTGLVAGMSGSPMYVGGKLIGALSGGWAFSKEPVGVVTPIESMLAILESPAAPAGGQGGGAEGRMKFEPFATPVFSSGIPMTVMERWRPRLAGWGFSPMSGSAVRSDATSLPAPELVPGSALCVPLIEGDLSLTALGTMTCRRGDRVLAFGHAMAGFGAVELPMSAAIVHAVVPSYMVSIKVGNATAPVGTLLRDERSGVMGVLGARPQPCPLEVRVTGGGRPIARRMRVVRHPELSGSFLSMAAASVVLEEVRAAGPLTLVSRIELGLPGNRTVRLSSAAATTDSPAQAVSELLEPVNVLLDNSIQPLTPVSASVSFEAEPRARLATLDSIRLNKPRFRPGETVQVTAILRTYGGGSISRTAELTLPADLERAAATVEVHDARSATTREQVRNPGKHSPRDLPSLIALMESARSPRSLWVRLAAQREGAGYGGRELPGLPGSVVSVFGAPGATGFAKLAADVEVEMPIGWVVMGQDSLPIEVLGDAQR